MQSYSHRSSIVSLKYGLFMFTIIAQALDPCQSQISNSHKYRHPYIHLFTLFEFRCTHPRIFRNKDTFSHFCHGFNLPSFCIVWFVKQFSLYKRYVGHTMYP